MSGESWVSRCVEVGRHEAIIKSSKHVNCAINLSMVNRNLWNEVINRVKEFINCSLPYMVYSDSKSMEKYPQLLSRRKFLHHLKLNYLHVKYDYILFLCPWDQRKLTHPFVYKNRNFCKVGYWNFIYIFTKIVELEILVFD